MYKKILVPLDGSKLAECALRHAEELARAFGAAEVTLVSVTEQVQARTKAPEAQELRLNTDRPEFRGTSSETVVTFGKEERQANRYLARVAGTLEAKGIRVHREVLPWPPAKAITTYAEEGAADIIVISSHGRSGPSRRAYGSVAEKVLKASRVPVLMIKATASVAGA